MIANIYFDLSCKDSRPTPQNIMVHLHIYYITFILYVYRDHIRFTVKVSLSHCHRVMGHKWWVFTLTIKKHFVEVFSIPPSVRIPILICSGWLRNLELKADCSEENSKCNHIFWLSKQRDGCWRSSALLAVAWGGFSKKKKKKNPRAYLCN